MLDGFVGSDIEALCREAGLNALRENIHTEIVNHSNFMAAVDRVHATMTPAAQEYYEKIETELKTQHSRTKDEKSRMDGFV